MQNTLTTKTLNNLSNKSIKVSANKAPHKDFIHLAEKAKSSTSSSYFIVVISIMCVIILIVVVISINKHIHKKITQFEESAESIYNLETPVTYHNPLFNLQDDPFDEDFQNISE